MRMRALLSITFSSAIACSSVPNGVVAETPSSEVDAAVPETAAPEPLSFSTCASRYKAAGATECATFDVPLERSNASDTRRISIHVAHKKSNVSDAPQVWLVQGGPGLDATSLLTMFVPSLDKFGSPDVYVMDHRGTGMSSRLTCSANTSAECAAQIDAKVGSNSLAHFTSTNAARDLDEAIARTRTPTSRVFVYGLSYGAYLAHRFTQLTTQKLDGVVFDGWFTPGATFVDHLSNPTAPLKRMVATCVARDERCKAALGATPWTFIESLLAQARLGSACPASGATFDSVTSAVATWLRDYRLSPLVPALLYRLSRCNSEDAALWKKYGSGAAPLSFTSTADMSMPLYYNIIAGDLWPQPSPSRDDIATLRAKSTVGSTATLKLFEVLATWPRYPNDPLWGKWGTISVPMLALSGGFDTATPTEYTDRAKLELTGNRHTFVNFPYSTHCMSSFAQSATETCGPAIVRQFLENPAAIPDTSCVSRLEPEAFTNDAVAATLGLSSTW